MKNQYNNIGDKLNNYDSPIPNDLFSKIETKRGWKPKALYHLRTKGWVILLLLGAVAFWALDFSANASSKSTPNLLDQKTMPQEIAAIKKAAITQNAKAIAVKPIVLVKPTLSHKTTSNDKPIITNSARKIEQKNKQSPIPTFVEPTLVLGLKNQKQETRLIEDVNPVVEKSSLAQISKKPVLAKAETQLNTTLSTLRSAIQTLNPIDIKLPDPSCYDFGRKSVNWRFSLDALVSPDYTMRSLKIRNNDNAPSYLETREETEAFQYAFSTGLRLSAQMDNGIAIRAGINYSQINESFIYQNERETQTIITEITDADGNIIRMDTVRQTGMRYIEHYNKFQQIDIPVMLAYDLDLGRWSIGLNGGAYFNILFSPKGRFLAEDGLVTYFTPERPDAETVFKDNLGISLYGSLAINYHINERLDFMIEPHFKYQLDPITVDGYILDQSYNTIGIHTGIRFYFD